MAVQFTNDQRANAQWVARANEFFIGQHDQRISAFDLEQSISEPCQRIDPFRAGDQLQNRFRVGC